jgi:hypothetical protein
MNVNRRSSNLWWLVPLAALTACGNELPVVGGAIDSSTVGDAPDDLTDAADADDGQDVAVKDGGDVVAADADAATTDDVVEGGDVVTADADAMTVDDVVDGGDVVTVDGDVAVTDVPTDNEDVIIITDVMGCAAGEALCGGRCIPVSEDNMNCGGCGMACSAGTTCRGGTCIPVCGASEVLCGSPPRCTNVQTDTTHCGMCGNACPMGQMCAMGACAVTCPAPGTVCTSAAGVPACVQLRTDAANCGACGNRCTSSQMCVDGACQVVCPTGATACGDACVDLQNNTSNCGACGRACPGGLSCVMGACTCPTGQSLCGSACVDTNTNAANCGSCGVVCSMGRVCMMGRCVVECPAGQTVCSDACVTVATDPANCGRCGNACPTGQVCTAGACGCPSGQTLCGTGAASTCVDLTADVANCGRCGNACATGQTCAASTCRGGAPANDTRAGAIAIDLRVPSVTLAANTTLATNNTMGPTGCSCTAGNDLFYTFTLTAPELVYADTFGSTFDTSLFFQDATGANLTTALVPGGVLCNDDSPCAATPAPQRNAQVYTRLNAGRYFLVLSGCNPSGAATIHFQHLPVGSGAVERITSLAGTQTFRGTNSGTGILSSACATMSTAPESTWWSVTCPDFMGTAYTATTCGTATWDTVLDQRSATRTPLAVCNDDACGLQSTLTNSIPAGAGLHTLYLEGYNAAALGAFGLTIRFGACPAGQTACGMTCVNTATDAANCGRCGNACITGQTCTAGVCACPTGQTVCAGRCVTTATDTTNCGACGNACATGQSCSLGRCVCPVGQTLCGGRCVSTQTDPANCGACATACAAGQSCTLGRCVCPAGQTLCGRTCVNTLTDAANCGGCGTACAAGMACVAGRCACPTGQTACGRACVNLQTDRANCGACARACATNASCTAGVCAANNNTRASATVLTLAAGETTVTGTTAGATLDGPTTCGGAGAGPNVWYRFTLTQREIVYADTAGSAYDTRLYLVDAAGSVVAGSCNDDAGCTTGGFTNTLQSRMAVVLAAGTYDLAVGGFNAGASGAFTLHLQHISATQGTNLIATAISGTATTATSTLPAGGRFTPACVAGTSGEDVRWFVTCGGTTASVFSNCAADGATYTRQIGATGYDPVMVVWSGQTNAAVACNDDGPGTVNCRGTGGDTNNWGARIQATVPRGVATVIMDDRIAPSGLRYTLRHQIAP